MPAKLRERPLLRHQSDQSTGCLLPLWARSLTNGFGFTKAKNLRICLSVACLAVIALVLVRCGGATATPGEFDASTEAGGSSAGGSSSGSSGSRSSSSSGAGPSSSSGSNPHVQRAAATCVSATATQSAIFRPSTRRPCLRPWCGSVSTWSYKSDDPSVRRMGPIAQDLYRSFGLGDTDKAYTPVDVRGIALAAIQGLYERVQAQEARIEKLEKENAALRRKRTRGRP